MIMDAGGFSEPNCGEDISLSRLSYAYVPTTGTNNTLHKLIIDLSNATPGTYYATLDVDWVGFDSSNTDGTFNLYFHTSGTKKSDGTGVWSDVIGINNALHKQANPLILVTQHPSGKFHYRVNLNITQTHLDTYRMVTLGLRSDYSNGTGWIRLSNFHVYKSQYNLSTQKMQMNGTEMIAHNFIEI